MALSSKGAGFSVAEMIEDFAREFGLSTQSGFSRGRRIRPRSSDIEGTAREVSSNPGNETRVKALERPRK